MVFKFDKEFTYLVKKDKNILLKKLKKKNKNNPKKLKDYRTKSKVFYIFFFLKNLTWIKLKSIN